MYLFQKPPCRRRQRPADSKLKVVMVSAPQRVAMAGTADVDSRLPVGDIGWERCLQARRILALGVESAGCRSWNAEVAVVVVVDVAGVVGDDGGVRVPHVPSRCRVPY